MAALWPALAAGAGALVALGIALAPVWRPFWAHDSHWHQARIAQWHVAMRDGVLLPRFLHDVFWGHGGPVLFYPPLPYYLTEIFSALGIGPTAALNYGLGLGLLAGSAALFALARPALGLAGAGVAAAAYALVPYRLLDAYVRAAYAELLATAVVPVLLLAARRLGERRTVGAAIATSLATAALVLTHGATLVFGLPLALAYGLWCAPQRRAAAIWLAGAAAVGLGLCGFYVVPTLLERQHTEFANALTRYYNYEIHFLWFEQLFRSGWGFGNSVPGPQDGMSFQLGWVHCVALAGSLVLALRGPVQREASGKGSALPLAHEARFWLAACAVAIFLTLEASSFVWKIVPLWPSIQFPWRMLVVTAIGTSLLVGALVRLADPWPPWARAAAAAVLAGLCIVAYRGYVQVLPPRHTDADFTPAAMQTRPGEDPIWMPRGAPRGVPTPRLTIEGAGTAEVLEDRTEFFEARVRAAGPATALVGIFAFPGWRAEIDGAPVELARDPMTATLRIPVPAGEHTLRLEFRNTPPRTAGNAVSLAAVLAGGAAAVWLGRRRN